MGKKKITTPMLLLAPAFLLLIIFFIIPVGYLITYSLFKYDPLNMIQPTITFENYIKFFKEPYTLKMAVRTFRVALITSIVTLIIGYPLAYYMRISKGTEKSIIALIVLT